MRSAHGAQEDAARRRRKERAAGASRCVRGGGSRAHTGSLYSSDPGRCWRSRRDIRDDSAAEDAPAGTLPAIPASGTRASAGAGEPQRALIPSSATGASGARSSPLTRRPAPRAGIFPHQLRPCDRVAGRDAARQRHFQTPGHLPGTPRGLFPPHNRPGGRVRFTKTPASSAWFPRLPRATVGGTQPHACHATTRMPAHVQRTRTRATHTRHAHTCAHTPHALTHAPHASHTCHTHTNTRTRATRTHHTHTPHTRTCTMHAHAPHTCAHTTHTHIHTCTHTHTHAHPGWAATLRRESLKFR